MVSKDLKTSMVIAGRGARACDMCVKERAKWYCAADEAYLCDNCDGSVHSANAVAKRHERRKLGCNGTIVKIKSLNDQNQKVKPNDDSLATSRRTPSHPLKEETHTWCSTIRKRSRTPRKGPNHSNFTRTPFCEGGSIIPVVKEEKDETSLLLYDLLTADDHFGDFSATSNFDVKAEPFSPSSTLTSKDHIDIKIEEADFCHEVPSYDPLLEDLISSSHEDIMEALMPSSPSLCNVSSSSRASTSVKLEIGSPDDTQFKESKRQKRLTDIDGLPQDQTECSGADGNESLSVNEDSDIDTFDVMDLCSNANFDDIGKGSELTEDLPDIEMWKSAYTFDQGNCSNMFEGNPFKGKGERELALECINMDGLQEGLRSHYECDTTQEPNKSKPLCLRLNYEDVINAWSDKGSLWMDGQRPQVVPDINILDHGNLEYGMIMMGDSGCNNSVSSQAGQVPPLMMTDNGREARVMRYKEKRRTRLFSKKIRYEVRKLNAERRPRMKGRFVKRTVIAAVTAM
ncbi:hypothetical protein KP509_27G026400 [Ceratopteris richardii]|uniref:Uncharacterized protein n=1 Tax=Ceratopteris richardii TaxID=49495 RepID=A0A8T2RH86_CERRI|nr:hypothetical protein KP509_27G026400 [Ceratopteris richardii]KAH7294957.1 hypothetical protein KP509_27G026400 [Ceratopteris richardii]KAH7294958.1 hypothetical protein KP509_27G026400 [Ceratopteris richardii]